MAEGSSATPQTSAIDSVMQEHRVFPPPPDFSRKAGVHQCWIIARK